jgi:hypothetical protein
MTRTMRRWERSLLGVAVAWGLTLPILALLMPVYAGESVETSSDGTGVTTASSATLVQMNGLWSLAMIAVPFVVAIVVALVLWLRRPPAGPGAIAWILVGLLGAANVLALLSVGIFVLPVTVCLVAACAIRTAGPGVPAAVPPGGAAVLPGGQVS